jgi:hypothetical protein
MNLPPVEVIRMPGKRTRTLGRQVKLRASTHDADLASLWEYWTSGLAAA